MKHAARDSFWKDYARNKLEVMLAVDFLLNARRTFVLKVAVCLPLVILLAFCFVPIGLATNSAEADNALGKAENELGSAFAAVAAAKGVGANVVELLMKLDEAGGFLSEGYIANRAGNYDEAVSMASTCSNLVEGVAGDAEYLKLSAERAQADSLLLTAVGSIIGLILLIVLGFLGWNFLKELYSKRVLELRPLVEEHP